MGDRVVKVQSDLILAQNQYSEHEDKHATTVVSVPWEDALNHPRLSGIIDGYTPEHRAACEVDGVFRMTLDYGFEEDYKNGVGLVIRDLTVDTAKLSEAKEQKIVDWVKSRYDGSVTADNLAGVLQKGDVKNSIIADMTAAGMARETFIEAYQVFKADGDEAELPFPVEAEDMDRIVQSVEARGFEYPEAYYDSVANPMREAWPSSVKKNYGDEDDPKNGAQVIFFTGFNAVAPMVFKTGEYAKQPAWPSCDDGFDEYDENGVALDEEGAVIPAGNIPSDRDYTYHPELVISKEMDGAEAEAVIDRMLEMPEQEILYDGFSQHCFGVGGDAAFGPEAFNDLLAKLGAGKPEGSSPAEAVASGFNSVVAQGGTPEGYKVYKVNVDLNMPSDDPQGIMASMNAISGGKALSAEAGLEGSDWAESCAKLSNARISVVSLAMRMEQEATSEVVL